MGKGLSITAFILSLLFFIPFSPIIGSFLGIIGIIKARNNPHSEKGFAIAAIPIGIVFFIFQIILYIPIAMLIFILTHDPPSSIPPVV